MVSITYLKNGITLTSHFPRQWKISLIVMILETGNSAHDVKSYRPISLLPVLSNIFERISVTQLLPDSDEQISPEHQFGFRREHSTIQ